MPLIQHYTLGKVAAFLTSVIVCVGVVVASKAISHYRAAEVEEEEDDCPLVYNKKRHLEDNSAESSPRATNGFLQQLSSNGGYFVPDTIHYNGTYQVGDHGSNGSYSPVISSYGKQHLSPSGGAPFTNGVHYSMPPSNGVQYDSVQTKCAIIYDTQAELDNDAGEEGERNTLGHCNGVIANGVHLNGLVVPHNDLDKACGVDDTYATETCGASANDTVGREEEVDKASYVDDTLTHIKLLHNIVSNGTEHDEVHNSATKAGVVFEDGPNGLVLPHSGLVVDTYNTVVGGGEWDDKASNVDMLDIKLPHNIVSKEFSEYDEAHNSITKVGVVIEEGPNGNGLVLPHNDLAESYASNGFSEHDKVCNSITKVGAVIEEGPNGLVLPHNDLAETYVSNGFSEHDEAPNSITKTGIVFEDIPNVSNGSEYDEVHDSITKAGIVSEDNSNGYHSHNGHVLHDNDVSDYVIIELDKAVKSAIINDAMLKDRVLDDVISNDGAINMDAVRKLDAITQIINYEVDADMIDDVACEGDAIYDVIPGDVVISNNVADSKDAITHNEEPDSQVSEDSIVDNYVIFDDESGVYYSVPDEIYLHVFSYLSAPELTSIVQKVCKDWHRLVDDHALWRALVNDLCSESGVPYNLCAGAIDSDCALVRSSENRIKSNTWKQRYFVASVLSGKEEVKRQWQLWLDELLQNSTHAMILGHDFHVFAKSDTLKPGVVDLDYIFKGLGVKGAFPSPRVVHIGSKSFTVLSTMSHNWCLGFWIVARDLRTDTGLIMVKTRKLVLIAIKDRCHFFDQVHLVSNALRVAELLLMRDY